MGYVFSVLLILVFVGFLFFSGFGLRSPRVSACQKPVSGGSIPSSHSDLFRPLLAKAVEILSKEEIVQRLKALSKTQPKITNTHGAMCYAPVMMPDHADYICPACGEKTVYPSISRQADYGAVLNDIPMCRRNIAEIKGLSVKLNESEYCSKCSPDAKTPALVLKVWYRDVTTPHITRGVTSTDIKILGEFLMGKEVHRGLRDDESPLRDSIPRLQELLGVKL